MVPKSLLPGPGLIPGAAIVINTILCVGIGALVGGLPGGQLGLVFGICLAFLPQAWRSLAVWLRKPHNILRFVAREASIPVLRGASRAVDLGAVLLSPAYLVLRVISAIVRVVAELAGQAVGATLGRFGRLLATPLGLANLAAAAIVAADLASFNLTFSVVVLGFVMLVLVLLVSENEARNTDSAAGRQT